MNCASLLVCEDVRWRRVDRGKEGGREAEARGIGYALSECVGLRN